MDLTIPLMIVAGLMAGRGKPAAPRKRGGGSSGGGSSGGGSGGGGSGSGSGSGGGDLPSTGPRPTMGFGGLGFLTGRAPRPEPSTGGHLPPVKIGIDGAGWGSEAGDLGGGGGDLGGA